MRQSNTEAELTIITGYPPRMMELKLSRQNGKFRRGIKEMESQCPQWKPRLCSWFDGKKQLWFINRHHRQEVENLVRQCYTWFSINYRSA